MEDLQQPPAPPNLRDTLDRLERILAAPAAGDALAELGRLGNPSRLDFLFRLELAAILRVGVGAEISPDRLLRAAQDAAAAGVLPLATLQALRRTLRRLEGRLRDAGAWDPARPLWWSPLPALSSTEELWQSVGRLGDALPGDRLATAFVDADGIADGIVVPAPRLHGTDAPRWLSLPALVPASFICALHEQLETAYRDGAFDLERAGVGAEQRLSSRRSDSVLYLSGLEPDLLEVAPAMAALAQWCLANLGSFLKGAGEVDPPRNVMLARYPAASGGYRPHLDNPGGDHDNGRALTFVLYLNAPEKACAGGEIAVWAPPSGTAETPRPPGAISTSAEATAVLPAIGGSAVLFDARTVPHQVRPLAAGPARWAMTLWFSDPSPAGYALRPVAEPSLTELLLPISDPPLTADKVLFHDLGGVGQISVHAVDSVRSPRVGIVCTVYRGGAGLDVWCEHHFALGVDHLVLIFDHLDESQEAADAERLAARYTPERLSVWSGTQVAERWGILDAATRGDLESYACSGSACWAVAARQTLNAGVALEAARGDELGGAPLDWLLHLDADELFYLEGAGRGGATLHQHFAAATGSGFRLLRYANHELLGNGLRGGRFKRNPHLASALLGPTGWSMLVAHLAMAQTDPRPYFTGYFNGKAAVSVTHAKAAAGVHGWQLKDDGKSRPPGGGQTQNFLAGPSVLHCHFADAAAFRRKYLAAEAAGDPESRLFEPSPVEVATFECIRALRREGADEAALDRGLDQLHATMTTFTDGDIELLEAAGLMFEPDVEIWPKPFVQ